MACSDVSVPANEAASTGHTNDRRCPEASDDDTTKTTTHSLFASVCKRLEQNDSTLTSLTLDYSIIRAVESGMTVLAAALLKSTHIHTLELTSARPDAQAAAALSVLVQQHNGSLQVLKLPNCHSNGLVPILVFQGLQHVSLQKRKQQQKANTNNAVVLQNSRLQVLELSGDSLDVTAAGALQCLLQTNKSLKALVLENMAGMDHCWCERAVTRGLQNNTTLQRLELVHCTLSDSFAINLASVLPHTVLRHVNLKRNCITDTGATALATAVAACPHLQVFSLAWNRWTIVVGVQAFLERLTDFTKLKELDLYNADLCVPLQTYLSMVDALESNYTLQSLSVGCESSKHTDVIQDLRFLWQEPEYVVAAKRCSFLLHLNQSGRRHWQRHRFPDCVLDKVLHKVQQQQQQQNNNKQQNEVSASAMFHLLRQHPAALKPE